MTMPVPLRQFLFACAAALLLFPAAGAETASSQSQVISGKVVSATDGHPLEGARVTILKDDLSAPIQTLTSGPGGLFAFDPLPPGRYNLQGAMHSFRTASYDEHDAFSSTIVTGVGIDTSNLVLRLSPNAVLSGHIIDEAGDPVRHAQVSLYHEQLGAGQERIVRMRTLQTDDLGAYEIANLGPGNYFVSASATPWYAIHPVPVATQSHDGQQQPTFVDPSLDVVYPTTFYPDVTEPEAASPIPVRGGEHLQVDIHFTPQRSLHLLIHLPQVAGQGVQFPVLQKQVFDSLDYVQSGGVRQLQGDLYEMIGVPPGKYSYRIGNGSQSTRTGEVNVTTDQQEFDITNSDQTGSFKLTASLADGSRPKLFINVLDANHHGISSHEIGGDKDEGEFLNLPPGAYTLRVAADSKLYSVVRMTIDGVPAPSRSIKITPGSNHSVAVILVSGEGRIQGTVERSVQRDDPPSSTNSPASGAMVVLVPHNPATNPDLFRRDQSDLDGGFHMNNVVPGNYTVVAIENGWDLEWARPEVIAQYLPKGQRITVPDNQSRPIQLPAPVTLQPR